MINVIPYMVLNSPCAACNSEGPTEGGVRLPAIVEVIVCKATRLDATVNHPLIKLCVTCSLNLAAQLRAQVAAIREDFESRKI